MDNNTPQNPAADDDGGGWQGDSASDPTAFEPAPADTTVGKDEKAAPPVKAQADAPPEAESDTKPDAEADAAGSEPVAVASADAKDADGKKTSPAPAGKSKPAKIAKREEALTKNIDRLTFQRRSLEETISNEQRRLEDLRRDIAAIEDKKKTPAPGSAADATPPAAKATPTEPPPHPSYKDFETDAEYEAAVAKWRGEDLPKWQAAREAALKAEIEGGVDARFKRERETSTADAERQQAVARLTAAIEAEKATHPEWDATMQSLKTVASSWATDDVKRQYGPTPFLSDVVENGKDGAKTLWWLASNPDEAQVLAELQPSKPLRRAIIRSSSPLTLLAHFATAEGQERFDQLRREADSDRVLMAVGELSAQLSAVPRGSATPAPEPITAAEPSAKPPVGSPRARAAQATPNQPFDMEKWMADEDKKERDQRYRDLGLPVPA